ncbi:NADP-dependent oxidoreductase [Salimicrobium humidisoli]|uniref:Quinone oxidoreductase n=1 Tax=Salimicrobium humidisoli TaxID=2029857 RepID=A0ABX4HVP3_9BACI|nr:NADP-dependent oxidoreductase [Salimicrobium humidisoli]PBB06902.1 quinone oxidoreductase [Salimicrobium humidisoli]
METMKAFVRKNARNDDVELENVAIPSIDKGEVLVKIQAFGVGVHDRYFTPPDVRFPYPIGIEGSGIVTKTGSDVSGLQEGDRVILSASMQQKGGSWAEYATVSSEMVVPFLEEIDFLQAAALPVAGKTAVESMESLDLKQGDTLFVAGASGAIGTLLIQLANKQGIRVIGSASAKNHEYMLSLGAEETVDYSNPQWKDNVTAWVSGGVDAALAIQPGTTRDSIDVVKEGGKVITVSDDSVETERNVTVHQLQHKLSFPYAINVLVKAILAGDIRPVLENVYEFKQALDALKKTETRHARGKLVVSAMRNC